MPADLGRLEYRRPALSGAGQEPRCVGCGRCRRRRPARLGGHTASQSVPRWRPPGRSLRPVHHGPRRGTPARRWSRWPPATSAPPRPGGAGIATSAPALPDRSSAPMVRRRSRRRGGLPCSICGRYRPCSIDRRRRSPHAPARLWRPWRRTRRRSRASRSDTPAGWCHHCVMARRPPSCASNPAPRQSGWHAHAPSWLSRYTTPTNSVGSPQAGEGRAASAPAIAACWDANLAGLRDTGSGYQPVMARAHSGACSLSVTAGNSRRSSRRIGDDAPCCSSLTWSYRRRRDHQLLARIEPGLELPARAEAPAVGDGPTANDQSRQGQEREEGGVIEWPVIGEPPPHDDPRSQRPRRG